MTEYVNVAVSPFYNGNGWTDRGTGIQFKPTDRIEAVRIAKDGINQFDGIANSIRLNNLLLLKGELPKTNEIDLKTVNPEELTIEELEKLVQKINPNKENNSNKLDDANKELEQTKKEKAKLELDLKEAQKELALLKKQLTEVEPTKEVLTEDELQKKSIADLKKVAKELDIKVNNGDKKESIINKIVKAK